MNGPMVDYDEEVNEIVEILKILPADARSGFLNFLKGALFMVESMNVEDAPK